MGCHSLLQGDVPDPGIEPASLLSPALTGEFFIASAIWESMRLPLRENKLWLSMMVLCEGLHTVLYSAKSFVSAKLYLASK